MMKPAHLTLVQKKILRYIVEHTDDHGFPPTVRKVGAAVGLTSTSTIAFHLAQFEDWGLITRDGRKSRSLEVTMEGRVRMKEADRDGEDRV